MYNDVNGKTVVKDAVQRIQLTTAADRLIRKPSMRCGEGPHHGYFQALSPETLNRFSGLKAEM